MRISDWSSDVCSSDLLPLIRVGGVASVSSPAAGAGVVNGRVAAVLPMVDTTTRAGRVYVRVPGNASLRPGMYARSEEHTSELQSLMRNSYAVFCLKTTKPPLHIRTYTDTSYRT